MTSLFIIVLAPMAKAGESVPFLSGEEFQTLSEQLSRKVDLFKVAWSIDPLTEFYGGTTRDFLYWVKGNFRASKSRKESMQIYKSLLEREVIEVKEFILAESDIDLVSKYRLDLEPKDYGVRTIDLHGPEIFDPASPEGRNELLQGHIPAEKIRLNSNGFVESTSFGDGVREIYQGRLTIHFSSPEDFEQSDYAQRKENHPILLSLRYLRLQAMDYFNSYGADYPNVNQLFAMDPESKAAVTRVCNSVLDGKTLKPYLKQTRFKSWLNGTIRKAFRSYTNPTAALLLLKEFKIEELTNLYEGIESINDYVFIKNYDIELTKANLKKFSFNEREFYQSISGDFPDAKFYQGTTTQ
jgi:hypothetical protein